MKLRTILKIISILGFVGIITKASFSYDITPLFEGILFLSIGLFLFSSSGYRMVKGYFEDNHISIKEGISMAQMIVGILSMVLGLITLPFIGWDLIFFNSVKVVIGFIAIFVILLDGE